jgi:hypothetical protein
VPCGHAAHQEVRYTKNGWRVLFVLDGVRFQVTVQKAECSIEAALRIGRLCYKKMDAGASKAECIAYRDELAQKLQVAGFKGNDAAWNRAPAGGEVASCKPDIEISSDEPLVPRVARGCEVASCKPDMEISSDEPLVPKAGMSGYQLFASRMRALVHQSMVAAGNLKPHPTKVITEVAKSWKAQTQKEKGKWNDHAKSARGDDEEH